MERFPGFGRAVRAPTEGVVIAAAHAMVDHPAFRGLPSLYYALTQQRRAALGWPALAGNHIMLRAGDIVIALCHLQRGSVAVEVGQTVHTGDPIGRCGNSGNSTEPHVHMQAFAGPQPERASPVRMIFPGEPPRNGSMLDI
ncbi:M23 family metallopeptidase [Microbacterium sp. Mu-80]|uniref:M23 family metallopeptidase n=1 Tax=Microbacterium bandirmense TaxID=3122050 RepID=A0ABU8L866_9MICO